jgi:exopolysaccharide biosynthesis polyprenyl glycosylphosphotransferase
MIKSFQKTSLLYIFADLILAGVSFYLPYIIRYNSLTDIVIKINLPYFEEYSFIFILWAIFTVISLKRRNLYSLDRGLSIPKEVSRVVISIGYAGILVGLVIFFAKYKFFSRLIFLESFILLCIFLSAWRIIKRLFLRVLIKRGFHNINVLIVGANRVGEAILREIKRMPWWGFRVVGFLDEKEEGVLDNTPILGKINDFSVIVKKYFVDEVIITASLEKKVFFALIQEAKNYHLGIRVVPENFEEALPVLDIDYLGIVPLLTYREKKPHPTEFAIKRFFDFVVSLFLLFILSPLFVVIAILIKLDSEGPVFYVQKRVGLKGRLFNFYKFRSMVKDAENLRPILLEKNIVKGGVMFKIKEDPRITRIGRFLRRYSLDELPQLFNVLRGDMSLVGPRPPIPEEVKRYNHAHMQRLSVRPGITGLPQVKGRSDLSFYDWVRWDLWYINNWSFELDLKILWWTIPAILKGKGAY